MILLAYSSAALVAGFILDRIFGDPRPLPHIVRGMGNLTALLERALRRALPATARGERCGGGMLVFAVTLICFGVPFAALSFCYRAFPPLGCLVETFLCYQLLAAKSLEAESMKVYDSLRADDMEAARKNVSMIVGRDTAALDRDGVARAAVETVAENASDGVAAPLFYTALGGAALGCLYKSVNTMDSMVGYKNDRYINFGRCAAKADDLLNFIPSRLCALLMIAGAYRLGFDGARARRIWRRDRRRHASPNSAQTESVCAGALGIRLAGPASYHGKTRDKPYIGDDARPIRDDDIVSANRLMYAASAGALILAVLFRAVCLGVVYFGTI